MENLTGPMKVETRIRYRQREEPAVVSPAVKRSVEVKFSKPQRAVAPGQAVVFYRGDRVLGGGWIK